MPNREVLDKIYDVLVMFGGAHEIDRFAFVHYHMDEKFRCTEFRFCGHFRLGGKYRIERNRIDYYREHKTPDLESKQATVNQVLKAFDKELGVIHYD